MTTRAQALTQEIAALTAELTVMAQLAEDGQEAAEVKGLQLIAQIESLMVEEKAALAQEQLPR